MTYHDPTSGPRGRVGADGRIRRAIQALWDAIRDRGVPAGSFYPAMVSTAPRNHCLMYGQTLTGAQHQYVDLWTNVDSTWKSGSDIIVPDMRFRIPITPDNAGGSDAGRSSGANTLGGTGGAETFTLADANLPSFVKSFTFPGVGVAADFAGGYTVNTAGSATAVNKMPPYILINYILKLV
jgi:microcystin-dependent protein